MPEPEVLVNTKESTRGSHQVVAPPTYECDSGRKLHRVQLHLNIGDEDFIRVTFTTPWQGIFQLKRSPLPRVTYVIRKGLVKVITFS